MGADMLDYIIAVSLLLLIVAQVYIAKGCFEIKQNLGMIPEHSEVFSSKFERISGLLDEAVEVLIDISGASPKVDSNPRGSPIDNIVNSLISGMLNPQVDAPKESEWTIQEENIPQVETEIYESA